MSRERFKKAIEERRLGFTLVSEDLIEASGSLVTMAFFDVLLTEVTPHRHGRFSLRKFIGYSDAFDRLGKIENIPEYSCHMTNGKRLFHGETGGVKVSVMGAHVVFDRIKKYGWVEVTGASQA